MRVWDPSSLRSVPYGCPSISPFLSRGPNLLHTFSVLFDCSATPGYRMSRATCGTPGSGIPCLQHGGGGNCRPFTCDCLGNAPCRFDDTRGCSPRPVSAFRSSAIALGMPRVVLTIQGGPPLPVSAFRCSAIALGMPRAVLTIQGGPPLPASAFRCSAIAQEVTLAVLTIQGGAFLRQPLHSKGSHL
jgi:hypothetical protein